MHRLRGIWLYLVVATLFIACKKQADPQPDLASSWQLDNDFLFDEKIQLNSYADSSLIILSGSQTTSISPGEHPAKSDTGFTHYIGQAQPNGLTNYRPLLTHSFLAFLYGDYVNVIPTASPVLARGNAEMHMAQFDPDFAEFVLLRVEVGEAMAANQQNQLIIPYERYDRSYSTPVIDGGSLYLALISVDGPTSAYSGLSIKQTQIIKLSGNSYPSSIGSAGNYFIVSTQNGTFRIAPDGTYQKTYPYGLLRQFTFNGTVYGITNANSTSLQLIASKDQGSTWSVVASQLPDVYRLLTYKQVSNLLIATYNSQLFQLNLTPTTLTTTELDNTGLFGNRITSVAAFRNTVYVSTLSGVFTKPLRTFLTPKKDK